MRTKRYPKEPEEWLTMPVKITDDGLNIGGWQVMQNWELPIMQTLAREIAAQDRDILEVGFGLGISATEIMKIGCRSYTVIEAHPKIAEMARKWSKKYISSVEVIEGFWEKIIPKLNRQFDSILFDTYPLSQEERHKNHYRFMPIAPQLLRCNGILAYYSDENLDFRAEHLRLLLTYFNEVKLIKVSGLNPPLDCEYWHDECMVLPIARKITTRIDNKQA
jgi:guanidinoacetate N-methyltransferase